MRAPQFEIENFCGCEDSCLSYTSIESRRGLRHYGLCDTVVIDDLTV